MQDPVAIKLMALFPNPNQPIKAGFQPQNDYYVVTPGGLHTDQGDGRVDYHMNDKNSIFGSISWSDTNKFATPPFPRRSRRRQLLRSKRGRSGPQCDGELDTYLLARDCQRSACRLYPPGNRANPGKRERRRVQSTWSRRVRSNHNPERRFRPNELQQRL